MDIGDLYLANLAAYVQTQNEIAYSNQEHDKIRNR